MKKWKQIVRKGVAAAMALATVVSVLPPTTASAASERATMSFEYCYDGAGNTIRYQQTFSHGGITCGHAGEARTRIFADGENAFLYSTRCTASYRKYLREKCIGSLECIKQQSEKRSKSCIALWFTGEHEKFIRHRGCMCGRGLSILG